MKIEEINRPILKVEYDNENNHWFWEIHLNNRTILKSQEKYSTKKEIYLHLNILDTCFKYLKANKDLDVF